MRIPSTSRGEEDTPLISCFSIARPFSTDHAIVIISEANPQQRIGGCRPDLSTK